jgi:hypothetical protein
MFLRRNPDHSLVAFARESRIEYSLSMDDVDILFGISFPYCLLFFQRSFLFIFFYAERRA